MTTPEQKPDKRQRQIKQLRSEIKKGIEQANRGELVNGETVFANIRAKSHRRGIQQKHT